MLLFGIGDTFAKNKRKWVVKDICEDNYTCETTDNAKKEKITKIFNKNEIIKLCV